VDRGRRYAAPSRFHLEIGGDGPENGPSGDDAAKAVDLVVRNEMVERAEVEDRIVLTGSLAVFLDGSALAQVGKADRASAGALARDTWGGGGLGRARGRCSRGQGRQRPSVPAKGKGERC
jgi:hypothetical protein